MQHEIEQCSYCRKGATDTIDGINICRAPACRTLAHNERADSYVAQHHKELEKEFGRLTGGEAQTMRAAREDVVSARKIVGTLQSLTR